MPAGLQVDAALSGLAFRGRAGSNPAQSDLVAENHPANALFQTWFDLKVIDMEKEIKAGQVWAFSSTESLPPLLVFIGRIDVLDDTAVASVQIKPHPKVSRAVWPDVGHLPVAVQGADIQSGRLVREDIKLGEDLKQGFEIWREQHRVGKAKFFTDSIKAAYSDAVAIRNEAIRNAKSST